MQCRVLPTSTETIVTMVSSYFVITLNFQFIGRYVCVVYISIYAALGGGRKFANCHVRLNESGKILYHRMVLA